LTQNNFISSYRIGFFKPKTTQLIASSTTDNYGRITNIW
jgi:hypothetical protein